MALWRSSLCVGGPAGTSQETGNGEPIWLELKITPAIIGGDTRNIVVHRNITERKYREQRLEVFNRILRHNLRNQLDVPRSHAEVLVDQDPDDHADRIIAAVDQLAAIGSRARKIDQIMSMDETVDVVALDELIDEVVSSIGPTGNDIAVTTELPASSPVTTNEEAMEIAVESALENALEHAESTVTVRIEESPDGYSLVVDDDGPGIPDDELVPIQTRTETILQHGRGLGLWQLRWSVDKLNGGLSFDTTDGTTVRINVPDQDTSTQQN